MLAGTISKCVGKGSRPKPAAVSHTSCMARSRLRVIKEAIALSSCRYSGFGEELLERRVDVVLALDSDADEFGRFHLIQGRHQGACRPPAIGFLFDLAVSKEITALDDLAHQFYTAGVVFVTPVIAV